MRRLLLPPALPLLLALLAVPLPPAHCCIGTDGEAPPNGGGPDGTTSTSSTGTTASSTGTTTSSTATTGIVSTDTTGATVEATTSTAAASTTATDTVTQGSGECRVRNQCFGVAQCKKDGACEPHCVKFNPGNAIVKSWSCDTGHCCCDYEECTARDSPLLLARHNADAQAAVDQTRRLDRLGAVAVHLLRSLL